MKIAILGSGNLGTDLLVKVLRSPVLECAYFIGRHRDSSGLAKARSLGVHTSSRGIETLVEHPDEFDVVFDCTSAEGHLQHWPLLDKLGKKVIDLTPAKLGRICVPAVNLEDCREVRNVNLVTCGGQTSLPIIQAIKQYSDLEYVETVSTIASASAGPATRGNIDEYIDTTREALHDFTGCKKTKAILILSPAVPATNMQTTVSVLANDPDLASIIREVRWMVEKIQAYVPGYRLVRAPFFDRERIVTMVAVEGMGDHLPKYAGNLDIINCAAVAVAEAWIQR